MVDDFFQSKSLYERFLEEDEKIALEFIKGNKDLRKGLINHYGALLKGYEYARVGEREVQQNLFPNYFPLIEKRLKFLEDIENGS